MSKLLVSSGIVVAAMLVLVGSTLAAIINVPGDYPTIQGGIDAASPGDTVSVAAGTYYENITLKDGVILQGAGAEVTTINGSGSGAVVMGADNAKIDGFTIKGGGIGIHLESVSSMTVSNTAIRDLVWSAWEWDGAILLSNSSGNTIKDNQIKGSQYSGRNKSIVLMDSSDNEIAGNDISDGSVLYGIQLVNSSSNRILHNNISNNTGDGDDYIKMIYLKNSSSNTVSYNTIKDTFTIGDGCGNEGIRLEGSSDNMISYNNISDLDAAGIMLRLSGILIMRDSTNNTITNNNISKVGPKGEYEGEWAELRQAEGIEVWASDNEISNNTLSENMNSGIKVWGDSNIIINNKVLKNGDNPQPHQPRGGPQPGIKLFGGANNKILGNIVTNNKGGGILLTQRYQPPYPHPRSITNNIIVSNTINGNGQYGIRLVESLDTTITNNIISESSLAGISCEASTALISYNDVWDNGIDYENCAPGVGDISADPMFVDPATNNYRLQEGSPCIDAGTNDVWTMQVTDFDGNLRIYDGDGDGVGVVDIGAFEFGSPPLEINIAINEIMYNPATWQGSDSYNEYVELYNYGTQPVNASLLKIGDWVEDDRLYSYDGGSIVIPPGGYAIITDKITDVYETFNVDPDAIRLRVEDNAIGRGLGNGGDLVLLSIDGIAPAAIKTVERVVYDDTVAWHRYNADGYGAALQRIDPLADPQDPNNWCGYLLTPGRENSCVMTSEIDIDPDTLNLKSKGKWITCYIEFPEGYSVEEVDVTTVAMSEVSEDLIDPPIYTSGPSETGDYDGDSVLDLMVKFDRSEVQAVLEVGEEVLTVTGELYDGTPFVGSDIIRVIDKGKK